MIYLDDVRGPKLHLEYVTRAPTECREKPLHMIVLSAKCWIAICWRVKK